MQILASRKQTHLRRLLSLLTAAVLVLSLALTNASSAYADDSKKAALQQAVAEAKANKEAADKQLAEAQQNTANIEAQVTALQNQQTAIKNQISAITAQKADIDNQINEKTLEIDQKQAEVDAKQAEFDERWAGFKERMRAMQMLNDGGSISLLSSASNLYQLLTFVDTLEQISTKDTEICQEIETARTELENQKADLEADKADLEAKMTELEQTQADLDESRAQLQVNIAATNEQLTAAEAEEAAAEAAAEEARKQEDSASAALDSYLASQNKKYGNASIKCSLNFGAPLATYKYISCVFGTNGHRGTDYAAPGGTEIYSVADGVVTAAGYHYSWGNYVQVYHGTDDNGNTYSTLYAHMIQTPSVTEGQSVSKGQLLGYVGSTGYSTGNHLHLELKVNGVLTNVVNYLG